MTLWPYHVLGCYLGVTVSFNNRTVKSSCTIFSPCMARHIATPAGYRGFSDCVYYQVCCLIRCRAFSVNLLYNYAFLTLFSIKKYIGFSMQVGCFVYRCLCIKVSRLHTFMSKRLWIDYTLRMMHDIDNRANDSILYEFFLIFLLFPTRALLLSWVELHGSDNSCRQSIISSVFLDYEIYKCICAYGFHML